MEEKLSQMKVKEKIQELLSSREGMLVLLGGSLMISDFDDPDLAIEEALKTFNSNRAYFERMIERAQKASS